MELHDSPSLSHRPQACQPDPVARPLAPWYLQHRDQGWDASVDVRQDPCLG